MRDPGRAGGRAGARRRLSLRPAHQDRAFAPFFRWRTPPSHTAAGLVRGQEYRGTGDLQRFPQASRPIFSLSAWAPSRSVAALFSAGVRAGPGLRALTRISRSSNSADSVQARCMRSCRRGSNTASRRSVRGRRRGGRHAIERAAAGQSGSGRSRPALLPDCPSGVQPFRTRRVMVSTAAS